MGRAAVNELTLINNLLNTKCITGQTIGNHKAVLETLCWRLAAMHTDLNDLMKLAIMMATLIECHEYERLITYISVMKEENTTSLIEKVKRLGIKLEISTQEEQNRQNILLMHRGSLEAITSGLTITERENLQDVTVVLKFGI